MLDDVSQRDFFDFRIANSFLSVKKCSMNVIQYFIKSSEQI